MSWGKGWPGHCERVHGYPEAVRHFEQRGPVKSKRWNSNERPLVDTAETWFKNVKGMGPDDYYELVYGRGEASIRYCKPEENGDYRVLLAPHGWSTRGRWKFLEMHGWQWNKMYATTTGGSVQVPLNRDCAKPHNYIPAQWSACLTFNKAGLLIMEKSDHRPIYTRKSSMGDKAARKTAMSKLSNTLDLMVLRLPTFHQESKVSNRRGGPFRGISKYDVHNFGKVVATLGEQGTEISDDILTELLPFCQQVYNVSLSGRQRDNLGWADKLGSALPMVPVEKYRRSLQGALLRHSGLAKQHEDVELPKFMSELPKKWFSSRVNG